jgi:hypothetical protein
MKNIYFDYQPKEITETELNQKKIELYNNPYLTYGDSVKLRNDPNSPVMSVTNIGLSDGNIIYNKYNRCYLTAKCTYFNKSSQSFVTVDLPQSSLEKIK